MEPDLWRRVDALFQQALEWPAPERSERLRAASAGEEELYLQVASLLAAEDTMGDFLAAPWVSTEGPPEIDQEGHEPAAGDRLGPFRLSRTLGRGGMGVVYLAERADDAFEQKVAIKVLRGGRGPAATEARFRAERQILASLEHPGIARLLDGGTSESGFHYLVMEHVDGSPIDRFCDQRRFDVEARLALFLEVTAAVRYAHRNLIVHRDLKPGNILVSADGSPKLLDFGIAKLLQSDTGPRAAETVTGQRALTLAYASPEQLEGKRVTTASDVYSLGVILYQLLVGRLPRRFTGNLPDDLGEMLRAPVAPSRALATLAHDSPDEAREVSAARSASLAQLARRVRGDLDTVVAKALHPDAGQRYGSVLELDNDLRRHLEGRPVRARPPSWSYTAGKFLGRHRWAVASLVAFVGLLAGFAGTTMMQRDRLQRERDRAEEALEGAERERETAHRVADLMAGLFEEIGPERALGRQLTVRELLDLRQPRLAAELADEPEILATVQANLGEVYRQMGDYAEAERLLESALALREPLLPDDHPILAENLSDLAAVVGPRGDPPRARELLERALDIHRRRPIEDLDVLVPLIGRLAVVESRTGELDRAIELTGQVVALQQRRFGPDSPQVAHALHNLAVHHSLAGKYAEARSLYERVLTIQQARLPADDPNLIRSHHNLGVLHWNTGSLERSREHLDRALESSTRVFGRQHDETAGTLFALAELDRTTGHLARAEERYLAAQETFRALGGDDHPTLSVVERGRAMLAESRGDLDAAERLYRSALDRALRAPEGPGTQAVTLPALLAGVHLRRGELDEAARLLDRAEAAADDLEPTRHLSAALAEMLDLRAALHDRRGEAREAARARRRLVELTDEGVWPRTVAAARERSRARLGAAGG